MMNVVLSPLGFFFSIRFAPSEGFFLFHRSAPVTGTAAGKEYRKVLRSALLPRVAAFCEPLYSVKKSCQGGAASTVLSLALLLILYRRQSAAPDRSLRPPYRKILRAALPLAVTDDLRSGLSAAENLLVPRRLALYPGTVNALADYGMLCGMVFPVMMFPAAILFSLSELLVPELSRCAARGSRSRVRYLARRSLRVGLLFGLTAAGLLFSGAPALGGLLYGDDAVLWFP